MTARRTSLVVLAITLVLGACQGDASPSPDPTGLTGSTGPTSSTGATGAPGDQACALVTEQDAVDALGGPVDRVADPFAEGLVAGSASDYQGVCYYRPDADDGERFASILVFPPGYAETELDGLVEGALFIGGPGYDSWDVDGGVVVHKGDLVFAVGVVTEPGGGPDRSAALELATLAASRLPDASPDPDNPACRLLTEELAESALGDVDLRFADGRIEGDRSGCRFVGVSEFYEVFLLITQGPEGRTEFKSRKQTAAGDDGFAQIPGLGDDAFIVSFDLLVLVGDTTLQVTLLGPGGEPSPKAATELARRLVASL